LTRSGLTYTEVSSKIYHDSFCQSDSSVSLPCVIYFETFYLHAVSKFSCTNISFEIKQRRHGLNSVKMFLKMATPDVWRLSQRTHQHTQRTMQTGMVEVWAGLDRARNKPIYISSKTTVKNNTQNTMKILNN